MSHVKDLVEMHGSNPEPIEGYAKEENDCDICKGIIAINDLIEDDRDDYFYQLLCKKHKEMADDFLNMELGI